MKKLYAMAAKLCEDDNFQMVGMFFALLLLSFPCAWLLKTWAAYWGFDP